ncbi:MAG: hypothetical protein ACP5NX_01340 [Candidatus Bilamarchaeaceae archaeon]
MVNITVSVPTEMKKRMEGFPTINWSEVARQAFDEEIKKMGLLKELTATSKAKDIDIDELSEKIKKSIAKRHR